MQLCKQTKKSSFYHRQPPLLCPTSTDQCKEKALKYSQFTEVETRKCKVTWKYWTYLEVDGCPRPSFNLLRLSLLLGEKFLKFLQFFFPSPPLKFFTTAAVSVACCRSGQTWNLSNILLQWDSQKFPFYLEIPKLRQFLQNSENIGGFNHLFWSNYQPFCKFLLKYKVNPVILGKTRLNLANFR